MSNLSAAHNAPIPASNLVISGNTCELILERNLSVASNAITPAQQLVTLGHTRGHIPKRSLLFAISVTSLALYLNP